MADEKPPFEIIEDQPPKPKGKRKRYRRPLFGHIPWWWVGGAFTAGVILVAGILLTIPHEPELVYYPVTATVSPVYYPTVTPNPAGETILDIAESGGWTAVATSSLRLYRGGELANLLDTVPNPTQDQMAALAFSPDAKYLSELMTETTANASPAARLRVYNVETGARVRDVLAHEGSFAESYSGVALAYSPNGKLLASGAGSGWTVLMDAKTYEVRAKLNTLATGTFALAFSADSKRLTMIARLGSGFSANHDTAQVQVWDISNLDAPQQVMDRGAALYWPYAHLATLSADGRFAADLTQYGELEMWNLQDNRLVARFTMPTSVTTVEDVAISPKGDILAFAQHQGIVQGDATFTAENITVRALRLHLLDGSVSTYDELGPKAVSLNGAYLLRFHPDGGGLDYITGDGNNLLRWDFASGQTELTQF